MNNLKKLCLVLSAGSIAALSLSACSDDPVTPAGTAGTSAGGTATTAGTSSGGTGTAGTGTAGTATAGTASGGTGTAGTASGGTGGSGGASGGSGGKGGSGGASGGSGGASGGSGGGGGSGGASGPMCADIDGPSTDSATCATYCADAVATCGADALSQNKVKDAQTCATFCATFTQTQLCCRAYHVKNAATAKDPHCKHTVGIESCQ